MGFTNTYGLNPPAGFETSIIVPSGEVCNIKYPLVIYLGGKMENINGRERVISTLFTP